MKSKITFLVLLSLCFFNCVLGDTEKKTKIIQSDLAFTEKGFSTDTIFNLDNYKTIGEFQKARFKTDKYGKYSAVNLESGNVNYVVNLESVPTSSCFGFYALKMKNTLFIYKDSIVKYPFRNKSINYSIDSIYSLYKRDVFNNRREVFLSDSPNHLVLSFQLEDSTSIKTTKRLLNKVVSTYLKMKNDSLPLNLSLSYKLPIPPPTKE